MKTVTAINPAIVRLAQALTQTRCVAVMTHERPDPDGLGALIGLGLALGNLGKPHYLYCAGGVPLAYRFLPGWERVSPAFAPPSDCGFGLLLDCHEIARAGGEARPFKTMAALDHHLGQAEEGMLGLVDTSYSSAGEMTLELVQALGTPVTDQIAANLFAAISTDTGSFSFSNTTARCLKAASFLVERGARPFELHQAIHLSARPARLRLLGAALSGMELAHAGRLALLTLTRQMLEKAQATDDDTEGFVEYPRSLAGVELAALLRQTPEGFTRISLRAKGRVNAAQIAEAFGGGGHFNAAGFTLRQNPSEAAKTLKAAAAGPLGQAASA